MENGDGTPFEDSWVVDVPKQEVTDRFTEWEPDVRSLLEVYHFLPGLSSQTRN
jgi:hypothetical protein